VARVQCAGDGERSRRTRVDRRTNRLHHPHGKIARRDRERSLRRPEPETSGAFSPHGGTGAVHDFRRRARDGFSDRVPLARSTRLTFSKMFSLLAALTLTSGLTPYQVLQRDTRGSAAPI